MAINPAWITGGLSLLGSLFGGSSAAAAQAAANRTNIQLQKTQLDWQERMANTEWQRGVSDMKQAGINPMLAVSQGGASTPNVQPAQVIPEDGMARAIHSAADKMMQMIALKKMNAEAESAEEVAEQQGLTTDAMKVDMLHTGDYFKRLHDQTEKLKFERMDADSRQQLTATQGRIARIEEDIKEQTKGAQVSSAIAQSNILERQITLTEAQEILMRLDIPEKKAMAEWFTRVGEASPAAKAVMSVGQWLKMIFGAKP